MIFFGLSIEIQASTATLLFCGYSAHIKDEQGSNVGMSPITWISALASNSSVFESSCAPLILIADTQIARYAKRSNASARRPISGIASGSLAIDFGRVSEDVGRAISHIDSGTTDRLARPRRGRLCIGQGTVRSTQLVECTRLAGEVGRRSATGREQDPSRTAGWSSGRCAALRATTVDSTSSRSTSRTWSLTDSRRVSRLSRCSRLGRSADRWRSCLCGNMATRRLDSIHRRKHDRIPSAVRQLVGVIPAVMPEKKDRSALLSVS
jgi:hypothetical protein